MPCSPTNRPAARLLLALMFAQAGWSQAGLPSKEILNYTVEWRLITAGKARLSWSALPKPGDHGWQTNLHVESTGLVSKLFKVSDDYTSTLRADLCAVGSLLNAGEGSRHRETRVTFDYQSKKASYLEKDLTKNTVENTLEIDIPPCVHDVFGGLYLLRTMRLEPGQSTQVPISDGKKSVSAKVTALQRETVKTPAGTFKTVRYEAFLFNNVLYRRPAHLYVWLSDDARRVPVQIQVKMQFTIGTITLQLEKEGV